ncbi:MAG TPA: DUF2155 domain-containing protein [Acidocella sp.]|nr:MAG: hypothetical protein B7Z77_00040 [Acidocella sp. 20-58-15]HQT38473.1 DUF2155 domain-containing protein [Acidocella sp.]
MLSRKLCMVLALGCALPSWALAQTSNVIAVPPPPPMVASPSPAAPAPAPAVTPAPPPGLVTTPVPPAAADNAANATPPVEPNNWVPGKLAEIGVLDKVDGGIANLQVPVGGQVTSGDMQISVLACANRPPDQIPDVAIFVSIQTTDNLSGPPLFRGWMVRSVPADSVVGDGSDSLRVVSCS